MKYTVWNIPGVRGVNQIAINANANKKAPTNIHGLRRPHFERVLSLRLPKNVSENPSINFEALVAILITTGLTPIPIWNMLKLNEGKTFIAKFSEIPPLAQANFSPPEDIDLDSSF